MGNGIGGRMSKKGRWIDSMEVDETERVVSSELDLEK